MTLAAIHIYPVKSMAGQAVPRWPVTPERLVGDRGWAVRAGDGKLGSGKDSRRFRRVDPLFSWRARLADPTGTPEVCGPDGIWLAAGAAATDAALSSHCGQDLTLAPGPGPTHLDAAPVSLVGTATLAQLGVELGLPAPVDPRHLRVNLVIETDEPYAEDTWVDRRLGLGAAWFDVTQRVTRCRMVDIAQADLPALPGLLQATGARDACAAVYLQPLAAATVAVGDAVRA